VGREQVPGVYVADRSIFLDKEARRAHLKLPHPVDRQRKLVVAKIDAALRRIDDVGRIWLLWKKDGRAYQPQACLIRAAYRHLWTLEAQGTVNERREKSAAGDDWIRLCTNTGQCQRRGADCFGRLRYGECEHEPSWPACGCHRGRDRRLAGWRGRCLARMPMSRCGNKPARLPLKSTRLCLQLHPKRFAVLRALGCKMFAGLCFLRSGRPQAVCLKKGVIWARRWPA